MKYYFNDNGNLQGPFSKAELVGKPIIPDTLVWVEGMATWQPAKDVPMFADILDGTYVAEQPAAPGAATPRQNVSGQQAASGYGAQTGAQYRPQSPYAPQQETFVPGAQNPSQPQRPQQPAQRRYQGGYAPSPQPTEYQQPQQTAYQQPQQTAYQQPQQTIYSQPQPTAYQQAQPTAYPQPQQQPYPECVYAGPDPIQMQQGYPQPQPPYQNGKMPSNHIGWTLTGTILSALNFLGVFAFPLMVIFVVPLIFGIIGLSKGSSVLNLWTSGRIEAAQQASRQARTYGQASVWINVGLGVVGLLAVVFAVFLGIGIMSGALAGI